MNLRIGFLGGWQDSSNCLWSFDETNIQDSDLAFVQYTSGSTGEPKGVMVTFSALYANVQLIHNSFHKSFEVDGGLPDPMVGFSWLPLYHDLGLIFAAFAQFLGGWRMHYMSPLAFIKHPLRWMELMSGNKCSWSVAPDFAYGLVARKFKEAQLARHRLPSLDLSCVYYMLNGTEPIRSGGLTAFYETFSPYGLRQNWFQSGYGLAEHVVGVCWMSGYRNSRKNPKLVAVGNGHALDDSLDCRIVYPETCTECPNETIGELWISSPSVAAGYWGNEILSESVFRAQLLDTKGGNTSTFLRTGDLAFMEDGHLFICGRIKDLIIIGGRNYYPQDVELATQEADICIRPGCVAAFCLSDMKSDGEVAVIFEVKSSLLSESKSESGSLEQLRNVIANVRSDVAQKTGISLTRIVAISEGSIPKTTSGKIQRKASREALKTGNLNVLFDSRFGDGALLSKEVRAPGSGQFDMLSLQQSSTTVVSSTGNVHSSLDICSAFGVLDMNATLPENGLDSMRQIELLERLHQCCGLNISFYKALTVPIGVLLSGDECGMGKDIRQLSENDVAAIGLDPSSLEVGRGSTAPIKRGILDTFAVLVLLCLIAASVAFVPSVISESIFCIPIPICYGLWCFIYSILVFIAKWTLIGQYTEAHIPFGSIMFYRWWLVDRLVHIWEMFVGIYIVGTYWLWLFYKQMGADLPRGCQVQTYLRDFDLVSVGRLQQGEEPQSQHIGGRRMTTILKGQVRGSRMVLGAIRLSQVRIEEGAKLHPDCWVVPQLVSVNGNGKDYSTSIESSDVRYCRNRSSSPEHEISPYQPQWGEVLQMWISPLVIIGILSAFHSYILAPWLEEWMLPNSSRRVKLIVSSALLPLVSLFISRFLCSFGRNTMNITIGVFFAPFNHMYALVVNYGPLTVWVYRLFGAQIGKYSVITELGLVSPFAMKYLSIGDRCTVGKSFLDPFYVGDGSNILPGIIMEDDSSIGLLANVAGGVKVGHSSVVTIGSRVDPSYTIPPESNWYAHNGGSKADGIAIPGLNAKEKVGGGRAAGHKVISVGDSKTAGNNSSAIICAVCIVTIFLRVGFLVVGVAGYLICVDALSAGLSSKGVSLGARLEFFCFFHLLVVWCTVYTTAVLALFVRVSIMLNKESASLSNPTDYLRVITYCSKMSIDYAKAYVCLIIDATIWRVWLLRIMGVKVEDVSSVMHYMSRIHDGGVVKKGAVLDNTDVLTMH